jgi:zinc protease
LNEELYPNHPYGTQTTIGTGEDLKNPSMVKIHEFFDTYYVPNNMAVILAGDIDLRQHDRDGGQVFRQVEEGLRARRSPSRRKHPLLRPSLRSVSGPEAEWVDLAWRFGGITQRIRSCCNSSTAS